jgi:hypothetical protein
MNRDSRNPQVPTMDQSNMRIAHVPAVRVHCFFTSVCSSIPFCFQVMAALNEGDQNQMWEFIRV